MTYSTELLDGVIIPLLAGALILDFTWEWFRGR